MLELVNLIPDLRSHRCSTVLLKEVCWAPKPWASVVPVSCRQHLRRTPHQITALDSHFGRFVYPTNCLPGYMEYMDLQELLTKPFGMICARALTLGQSSSATGSPHAHRDCPVLLNPGGPGDQYLSKWWGDCNSGWLLGCFVMNFVILVSSF